MVSNSTYISSIVLRIDKVILDGPSSATISLFTKKPHSPQLLVRIFAFHRRLLFLGLGHSAVLSEREASLGQRFASTYIPPSIECGFESDTLLPLFPFLGAVYFSHFLTVPLFLNKKFPSCTYFLFDLHHFHFDFFSGGRHEDDRGRYFLEKGNSCGRDQERRGYDIGYSIGG